MAKERTLLEPLKTKNNDFIHHLHYYFSVNLEGYIPHVEKL